VFCWQRLCTQSERGYPTKAESWSRSIASTLGLHSGFKKTSLVFKFPKEDVIVGSCGCRGNSTLLTVPCHIIRSWGTSPSHEVGTNDLLKVANASGGSRAKSTADYMDTGTNSIFGSRSLCPRSLLTEGSRENPPTWPISAFLTFAYSHIQLLPLSQLHDYAFKPSTLYIEMIA
jgi:hypothetical protein